MNVFIASDHGGFEQKQALYSELSTQGFSMKDMGPHTFNPEDDYVDYGINVARSVANEPGSLGILLCRSGEGMDIVANKIAGIRAALVWRPDIAAETRRDNDSNILVIPSDFVATHDAIEISKTFITSPFSGLERHQRRIDKIAELEKGSL